MNLFPSERAARRWWSHYYARQNTPRLLGRRLADFWMALWLVALEDARALRRKGGVR